MKFISIFFFLMLNVLLFTACPADYNRSTQSPTTRELSDTTRKRDTIPSNVDQIPKSYDYKEMAIELSENEDVYTSENRGHWQRPRVVMRYFGDLDGKILADIGAGPNGYFTFHIARDTRVERVLALDIDQDALDFINTTKKQLRGDIQNRIETRLVLPNSAKLKKEEVDAVLIANTIAYIGNEKRYLKNLLNAVKKDGKLIIVDHKMKRLPSNFPRKEERMPLYEVEELLQDAGFEHILSDDRSLPYHYIVVCKKP